jgi:hypothetical protein
VAVPDSRILPDSPGFSRILLMTSHTMASNPIKQGLLQSLSWLSLITWLIVAFIATGIAAGQTAYPAAFGWIIFAVLMWIAAITAERWVRALPGMLGVAALNAIYSLVSGHFGLDPPKAIARPLAGLMTAALMAGAYLATAYMNRWLSAIDRAALGLAIASLLVGLSQAQLALPATIAIAAFLAAGVGYRHFRQ